MRSLLACLAVVALAGCGSNASTLTDPEATPSPDASPTSEPLVFENREGNMFARIAVSPPSPKIGETVRFDYFLKYEDDGDEQGAFVYDAFVEGLDAPTSGEECDSYTYGKDLGTFSTSFSFSGRFRYPGPYSLTFFARPACVHNADGAFPEGELTVTGEPDLPDGEVLLPHLEAAASTLVGTYGITIEGDAEKRCVYAVQGGRRSAALWPIGYRARFDPLRIYNERDQEVWREGVPRDSPGQPGGRRSRVPERCRTADNTTYTFDDD